MLASHLEQEEHDLLSLHALASLVAHTDRDAGVVGNPKTFCRWMGFKRFACPKGYGLDDLVHRHELGAASGAKVR